MTNTATQLTGATYRTRDFGKAKLLGQILVDQGFEVQLSRAVLEITDLNASETFTKSQGYETTLRTNADRKALDAARTVYRQAQELVQADAVAQVLAANAQN